MPRNISFSHMSTRNHLRGEVACMASQRFIALPEMFVVLFYMSVLNKALASCSMSAAALLLTFMPIISHCNGLL